ncbi:MAG: MFS transporter [Acidiferrobacter sp.]
MSTATDRSPLHILYRAWQTPRQFLAAWYGSYLLLGAATTGLFAILVPLLIVTTTHNSGLVAYVVGAYNAGLLLSPLWGILAERRQDYRLIFIGGFLVAAIALLGLSLPLSATLWALCAVGIGIGTGAASTTASLFIFDFAPRDEWEPRLGWLQSFNGAGMVGGLLLAGLWTATPAIGLRAAAILMAVGAIIGSRSLPVPHQRKTGHRTAHLHLDFRGLAAFGHSEPAAGNLIRHLRLPLALPLRRVLTTLPTPFGRFIMSWSVWSFAVAAFFAYFPILLQHTFAITPGLTAFFYALVATGAIGLYIAASRWCARFGAARIYRLSLLVRAGGFALLLLLVFVPLADKVLPALAGFAIIILAWPTLSVSGTVLAGQLSPSSEGAAIGLFNAATALAMVAGTFSGAPLVAFLGYAAILGMGLGGLLVSWIVFMTVGDPQATVATAIR